MDYDSIQKKLDCFALTAKISKLRSKEIETVAKTEYENILSKEILGNIMTIKRTEDRISTRLDYWIHGQLSNEYEGESTTGFSSNRYANNNATEIQQIWDFNLETSTGIMRRMSFEKGAPIKNETQVARSISSVKPAQTRRRKPWRTGKTTQREDSISMFAYNPKSRIEVDEDLSSGEILRKSMFSKFGTINSRKLKMFFSRDNSDQDDNKSRKSVKSENPRRLSSTTEHKVRPFFMKFKRKEKNSSELDPVSQNIAASSIGTKSKAKKRPKSLVSNGFDLDDISIPSTTAANVVGSLPDDEEDKRKTFRERLRSMPVFYVPSSRKGRLKVFE